MISVQTNLSMAQTRDLMIELRFNLRKPVPRSKAKCVWLKVSQWLVSHQRTSF